eukprot:scaffold442_cov397-Prasinococcus_capsulatus_cf.AAC.49
MKSLRNAVWGQYPEYEGIQLYSFSVGGNIGSFMPKAGELFGKPLRIWMRTSFKYELVPAT